MRNVRPPSPVVVANDRGEGRPDVVWIDNGSLRLGLVPALGGRLLSARVHGVETLWRNARLLDDHLHPVTGHRPTPDAGLLGQWSNYGGDKTWPAPQGWSGPGQWAGPPDPVLDSGPFDFSLSRIGADVCVELTSGHDARTGLRLGRRLTISPGTTAFVLDLEATNTSASPVTWALWNVTQRPAGDVGSGGVHVAVSDETPAVNDVVAGTGVPRWVPIDDGRVLVPHQDIVGKIGFARATGWAAHVAADSIFTHSFDVDHHATYPDHGSRVEVWMEHPLAAPLEHLGDLRPPARIVEVEVLGPLTTLDPGEMSTMRVRCGVGLMPATGDARTDVQVTQVSAAGHWTRGPDHVDGGTYGVLTPYMDGSLVVDGRDVADVRAGRPTSIRLSRKPTREGPSLALRRSGSASLVPAGSALCAPVTDSSRPDDRSTS